MGYEIKHVREPKGITGPSSRAPALRLNVWIGLAWSRFASVPLDDRNSALQMCPGS
ncbi:hypothetical protein U1Q18_045731, partial [Sarracenia purpurea var. burkii]